MPPALVSEFTFVANVNAAVPIGTGPFGKRVIAEVTGGTFSGERLSGTILPGGGDWFLLHDDGYARIDVRLLLRTADGAGIYMHYLGLMEYNDATLAAARGRGATAFADQYLRVFPQLETGDERYAWVNRTAFLAEGRVIDASAVEYHVYRVT
jgi:hypothetical protein